MRGWARRLTFARAVAYTQGVTRPARDPEEHPARKAIRELLEVARLHPSSGDVDSAELRTVEAAGAILAKALDRDRGRLSLTKDEIMELKRLAEEAARLRTEIERRRGDPGLGRPGSEGRARTFRAIIEEVEEVVNQALAETR